MHTDKSQAAALRASGQFDEAWYLECYPDVKMLGMDAAAHYLWIGKALGRKPLPTSGTGELKSSLAPLRSTMGQALYQTPNAFYVYVDHTVNNPGNTGVQRVTRGIARGLASLGVRVFYIKWDSALNACVLIDIEERNFLGHWNGPTLNPEEERFYTDFGNAQLTSVPDIESLSGWLVVPEVTHITTHTEPVTLNLIDWAKKQGLKVGFVFYDAIPLRRAEHVSIRQKHSYYMQQIRLADMIWPISCWSGNDLLTYWIDQECADVGTLPTVKPLHLPSEFSLEGRVSHAGEEEKIILSVGTICPHKNQLALIHAFQDYLIRQPTCDWQLLLVGHLHPLVAAEVQSAQSHAIRYLGPVSDEELSSLYSRAAFTVFPSLEEGFGLPILESLWYGKPCVCANFGAMGEVAEGGGCLTTDVRDPQALGAALQTMIEDQVTRNRLATEAAARPTASWHDYAETLLAGIDECVASYRELGIIYFWIDATRSFPRNTGIQRVTRMLARALMEKKLRLIPVVWGGEDSVWQAASPDDLRHLAQWNGPAPEQWAPWVEPEQAGPNSWFVMPELPLNFSPAHQDLLRTHAEQAGLRTLAVFHDAIPIKMGDIYPEQYAVAHRNYMQVLGKYDLISTTSQHSRADFLSFLPRDEIYPSFLDDRVVTSFLPGEFLGVARVKQVRSDHASEAISILSVGTVEPRKNHEIFVQAFAIACQKSSRPLRLTIVGGEDQIDPGLGARLKAVISLTPGVTWVKNASDEDLRVYYAAADFTVYPSIEEGFGLPILESLWNGRPCICADFGAMAEVGVGGGCLMTDVRDVQRLADAICRLADDEALRGRLAQEAVSRPTKTWQNYADDIAANMTRQCTPASAPALPITTQDIEDRALAMKLVPRPALSVCISTYNRAEWLSTNLKNWQKLYPMPIPGVELLVCDNASTDHTADIVAPYLNRPDFSYRRNPVNVGMLGNLRETAHAARGRHIWILGDDDLLMPGTIERILRTLSKHPDVALCYLNYSFTRIADARTVTDFDAFFRDATPIVPPEPDIVGPIKDFCARNENFFTAIYSLVFRRDHALNAYSQDTSGRPFSSMLTCIPTTHYVLNHMMTEPGVWIGSPQIVVNMNVSWMKYAPLWILERIPEVYEMAEIMGATRPEIDRWRRHTLPGIIHFFGNIFESDPEGNSSYFSPKRLVRRFGHLPEFQAACQDKLIAIYEEAHRGGHPAAKEVPHFVFSGIINPETCPSI